MLKVTQKEIKNFPAVDITNYTEEELRGIVPDVEEIAYSVGSYGCNGKLLHGKDGNFYKITSRSTNLFRF